MPSWDRFISAQGSTLVREDMLINFVSRCDRMTGPELEQQFCHCASLFLARLTSWLRTTYAMSEHARRFMKESTVNPDFIVITLSS